jgi:hypothetical protein
VRAATVAELAWVGTDGRPDALPVVPLLLDVEPAIAYPYAYADLARQIATAPAVALTISEPRMTGSGWRPLAATGRARLIEDKDGELFKSALLTEELRKYPPSRALADSLMLRREHWWYVPRMIVVLDLTPSIPVEPRVDASSRVLAAWNGDQLHIDTVRVVEAGQDRLEVTSLAGRKVPDGRAALVGHDFSEPDLERWTPWTTRGDLSGGVLAVTEWPERTTLEPVPKLRERFRRQRDLERACRAALESR